MMARRMMRKHHVRCRAGEKVEITSKPYLSLSVLLEVGSMLAKGSPMTDENRSEELRVGKECRSRWSPYH